MTSGSRGWFFLWKCWSNMIWTLKSMPPPPQFTMVYFETLRWCNFYILCHSYCIWFSLDYYFWKIKCEKNHRNVLIMCHSLPYHTYSAKSSNMKGCKKTFQWEIFSSISLIPKSHLVIIWKVKVPTERYKDPLQQPKRYASWSKSSSSRPTHR